MPMKVLTNVEVQLCVYVCARAGACVCRSRCSNVCAGLCMAYILWYLWMQGKRVCTLVCDLDLFMSRLINEEIKVSASQSKHKDIRTGFRRPAATSEMLISPFLYFPSTA